MANHQNESRKGKRIGYWITTGLLVFGMFLGGLAQLFQLKFNSEGMIHLGYPLYLLPIIGAWKIVGVIALLIPGYGLLKEWAYAGFFFVLTGAVISHIITGDSFSQWVAPFTFALLTVLSWYLRPANRRIKTESEPTSLQPAFS